MNKNILAENKVNSNNNKILKTSQNSMRKEQSPNNLMNQTAKR